MFLTCTFLNTLSEHLFSLSYLIELPPLLGASATSWSFRHFPELLLQGGKSKLDYILVFFALTEQPPPSVQRESSADRNWSLSEGLLTGTSALIGNIYSWTHC